MAALREWYSITNKADAPTVAELTIYDVIGRGFADEAAVTAKQFLADLAKLPASVKTLRVPVNSPGGDPFDATAIANALRAERVQKGRTVEVSIEGLAASAASIVTSAGKPIKMARNALVMIHNPRGLVFGPADDMRQMAEALDRVRDAIIATYRWTSHLSAQRLAEMMAATVWMDPEEALKNGFATEIVEGVKAAAQFRPEALASLGAVPPKYRAGLAALSAAPPARGLINVVDVYQQQNAAYFKLHGYTVPR